MEQSCLRRVCLFWAWVKARSNTFFIWVLFLLNTASYVYICGYLRSITVIGSWSNKYFRAVQPRYRVASFLRLRQLSISSRCLIVKNTLLFFKVFFWPFSGFTDSADEELTGNRVRDREWHAAKGPGPGTFRAIWSPLLDIHCAQQMKLGWWKSPFFRTPVMSHPCCLTNWNSKCN